ncbi:MULTISPECIES: hypothetical protein [unclassified Lysobacter]
MGLISLLWGIGMLLWMLLALIPLLGAMNWLVIPFAAFGAILGAIAFALTRREHRGRAKAGLVINLVVIVVAVIRLHLGWGVL